MSHQICHFCWHAVHANQNRRWSSKASQEATRLLGPELVNIASDARKVNDGKFGKIADESTWQLSPKPAMVYLCENEVCVSGLVC